jgi:glutathione S-transferase
MTKPTLYLGNKNYSSWSLRAWLVLKQSGLDFDEVVLPLRQPPFGTDEILKRSPSGKVPALQHGDLTVWESLAIAEYVAELAPEARLWPEDRAARAVARSISAEMATSFSALRTAMPMNLRREVTPLAPPPEVARDIARIQEIWRSTLRRFGRSGEHLFGRWTIADAMYAPVVTRFQTYGVEADGAARAYMRAASALPAMQAWVAAAREEPHVIAEYERA